MSDPRPLRFTRPDLLRALAPELLCELLVRFPAFLAAAGIDLADLGTNEKRFAACRPLIDELLKNGPTTPTPLVEALFIISVLAEPEPTEELWHTLIHGGIAIPPDASLADLALTLWLRAPDKARQLYLGRVQLRTRSFETHAARTFLKTASLRPVSDAALAELRHAIELFCIKQNRPAGCQVFAYQRGHEHWFMIRRSDRFKRIATVNATVSATPLVSTPRPLMWSCSIPKMSTFTSTPRAFAPPACTAPYLASSSTDATPISRTAAASPWTRSAT
ncbi:MAG: hypothetical protein H2172_01300 [Opitutus sp.]|nr:hypothetical protein [Opitutus sp.]MCS6246016.1 hypothetical protein [Opitutus sp.]MCS6275104.1 hypothetical protein [Opitutus sp.]MCS6277155.1 hypothetical protein [Opitutus sp.]MCS6300277.1 hypothetical protein [Opitutus sp.]